MKGEGIMKKKILCIFGIVLFLTCIAKVGVENNIQAAIGAVEVAIPTQMPTEENVIQDVGFEVAEPTQIPTKSVEQNAEICVELISVEITKNESSARGTQSDGYIPMNHSYTYRVVKRISPLLEQTLTYVTLTYVVYDYGDKVHLYSRYHYCSNTLSGVTTEINYGYTVNTDGSLSYTTGDRVKVIDTEGNVSIYDVDAEFTPTSEKINFIKLN